MFQGISSVGRKVFMTGTVAAVLASFAMTAPVAADDYPDRPVDLVVGFGTGGSADRMARAMSTFLSEELEVPVRVTNRPGAGGQLAASYILSAEDNGYSVLASTFAPYLPNAIVANGADFSIEDFSFINIQWFDMDIIAANRNSGYENLAALLEDIKNRPGRVRGAVIQGSAGHLTTRMLLDEMGIPQENLNLVTYQNGGEARSAVAGGQVDFIAISAQGSEGIREFLNPLAIVNDERVSQWDAPSLNEALEKLNLEVPVFQGSMRGLAVSAEFERQYPERFDALANAVQNTLSRKELQDYLEDQDIGGVWVGPERSNELMRANYDVFEQYAHLLK
ncbi:Bug family tripartite tricarboxylate transporter substrate binding protein [Billgrantia kenyensis]|uniref:Tripartite tricarboxylate transporter substrate binding protein n=1 Tax=Billgrantia kenyensis TaxID=321266 RepID=A0A7W0AC98_9GAMM|nr:tripartite tricarboxylate transporter substrate binding protein [Halomonas kenyensis]MBA2777758.1 tripartite tricarboxylate transporter substrate binding protein [Halomonas kenyensis]MCG6660428.1 tripartite tricarboxylate transporter substrate binding protein [Halomonas kenyensis]